MIYTVNQVNVSNCVACSTGCPQLGISLFRLDDNSDPVGLQCLLSLYVNKTNNASPKCQTVSVLFSAVTPALRPAAIALKGNYTCFIRGGSGLWNITNNSGDYSAKWFTHQSVSRADVWWMCGDMKSELKYFLTIGIAVVP